MATYDITAGIRALLGSNLVSDIDTGFLSLAQDAALALSSTALQEGVVDSGSFMVTQKGAGANMSVDVAGASGRGAWVQDDSGGGLLIYVRAAGSTTNLTIGANATGNPRVDRVILAGATGLVSVVAGTATVGATLDNLTGAAAVPSSALLLGDVLVANGAATIPNSVIRDRRKWARGASCRIARTANASAGTNYTLTSTTFAYLDSTNLAPRIECSGVPVRVRLLGSWSSTTSPEILYFSPQVDGVGVDGMASVGGSTLSNGVIDINESVGVRSINFEWTFTPTAGSHVIAPAFARPTGTVVFRAGVAQPLVWVVEEQVRQSTANNTTTSG